MTITYQNTLETNLDPYTRKKMTNPRNFNGKNILNFFKKGFFLFIMEEHVIELKKKIITIFQFKQGL